MSQVLDNDSESDFANIDDSSDQYKPPTGEIQTSTDDSQEETKGEKSKGTFICYNYRLQILTLTVITSTYRKETSTRKTEKT